MIGGRGLGVYPGQPCYDPNHPWWLPYWMNDTTEMACFNANPQVQAAVPQPAAPSTPQQYTTDATTPGAIYAGTDSNGNPVYMVPATPQQTQQQTVQTLTDYYAQLAANPSNQPTDCNTFFNSFFNPVCPGSLTSGSPSTSTWLLVGAAAVGALMLLKR